MLYGSIRGKQEFSYKISIVCCNNMTLLYFIKTVNQWFVRQCTLKNMVNNRNKKICLLCSPVHDIIYMMNIRANKKQLPRSLLNVIHCERLVCVQVGTFLDGFFCLLVAIIVIQHNPGYHQKQTNEGEHGRFVEQWVPPEHIFLYVKFKERPEHCGGGSHKGLNHGSKNGPFRLFY